MRTARAGAPLAKKLYPQGYTTPERYLDIDLDELLQQPGVGPKTVEKVKAYQQQVRARIARDAAEEADDGAPQ